MFFNPQIANLLVTPPPYRHRHASAAPRPSPPIPRRPAASPPRPGRGGGRTPRRAGAHALSVPHCPKGNGPA